MSEETTQLESFFDESEPYRSDYESGRLVKDWRFESTARALGIPSDEWSDPETHNYIGLVNGAQNIWENFRLAAEQQPGGTELTYYYEGALKEGKIPVVSGLEPSLGHRYARGERLSAAAVEILTDKFAEYQAFPQFLEYSISQALEFYGLRVRITDKPIPQTLSSETKSLDTSPSEDNRSKGDEFAEIASGLGIPGEHWLHPAVYQFINLLYNVEELSRRCSVERQKNTIEMNPPLTQRCAAVIALMEATSKIMREGFLGQELSGEDLQRILNEGLAECGLLVTGLDE